MDFGWKLKKGFLTESFSNVNGINLWTFYSKSPSVFLRRYKNLFGSELKTQQSRFNFSIKMWINRKKTGIYKQKSSVNNPSISYFQIISMYHNQNYQSEYFIRFQSTSGRCSTPSEFSLNGDGPLVGSGHSKRCLSQHKRTEATWAYWLTGHCEHVMILTRYCFGLKLLILGLMKRCFLENGFKFQKSKISLTII